MIKYIISNTCFAMGDTKIVCHIFIFTLTNIHINMGTNSGYLPLCYHFTITLV